MSYRKTIKFKRYDDPLLNKIRAAARAERYTMVAGFKEWARETYNATMRSNQDGDFSSITFYYVKDYNKFKESFEVE